MNPHEALSKLETAALRKHVVRWATLGPSQGDPGGQLVITWHCSAYQAGKMFETPELEDETRCDCPAGKHNEIIREAVNILKQQIES